MDISDLKDSQKVLQCLNCGNKTLMNLVGEHKNYWDEDQGYYGYFLYQMFACPICGKVTFFQKYWDVAQTDYDDKGESVDYTVDEILYPINTFSSNKLPKRIKRAYEVALQARNIDSALCLIGLRRTLELVCKDKEASGRDLWNKIEDFRASSKTNDQ